MLGPELRAGALRPALTTLTAIVMAALVAACGSSTPDTPPSASGTPSGSTDVEETILIWSDAQHAPALEASAAVHEAATGVPVLVESVGSDLAQIRADVTRLAPQGQGPDLFVGQSDWVGELVDSGLVVPVDLGSARDDFRTVAVDGFVYEGRTFGVPFATENLALVRNPDLAPKSPKTIEAMVRIGLAGQADDDWILPIALPVGPRGSAYHWYPLFSGGGGDIFGPDARGGYSKDDLRVDRPGSVRSAEILADLTERGAVTRDTTVRRALRAFTDGNSPYLITGPWSIPAIQDSGVPFVVEDVPGFEQVVGSRSQALVTTRGLLQSAFSAHAAAAARYLATTMMTTDVMTSLASPGSLGPAWNQSYELAAQDPVIAGFAEYADASVPTPNLDVMTTAWPALDRAQIEVMSRKDPGDAMAAAARTIQQAIDAG